MKSFAQVELNYCHQRDGLRPGSIADANDEGASRTGHQFGELTTHVWASSALELFAAPVIFPSCRFTNFIAGSAGATAKSSSARPIGKTPNARIAAQRNCPRNFPPSPRPAPAAMTRPPATAAAVIIVAAAVAMGIEFSLTLLGAPAGRRPVGSRKPELAGGTPALPGIVPRFRVSTRDFSFRGNLTLTLSRRTGEGTAKRVARKFCRPKVLAISELPTD